MRVASDGCILGFDCNTERTAHSASSSKLEATYPQDSRLEYCEDCTACLATVATSRPQTTTSSTTCNRPQKPLGLMCGNCSVRTQTLDLPPQQHLFNSGATGRCDWLPSPAVPHICWFTWPAVLPFSSEVHVPCLRAEYDLGEVIAPCLDLHRAVTALLPTVL